MDQPGLRPLGIGEILDRAVTLFVRRFALLALTLAVVAIPLAILTFAASSTIVTSMVTDAQRLVAIPAGHPEEVRAVLTDLSTNNRATPALALLNLATLVLTTLSTTACAIAAARAYAGRVPSVRAAYREALARWPAQIVAAVLFLGFAGVITVVVIFAGTLLAIAVGALASHWKLLLAIVEVVVIGGVAIFALAIWMLLYFAWQLTSISIALEENNPIVGIGRGIRRTVGGALWRRSLLVALALFAIALLGSFVLFVVGIGMSALAHLPALWPVVTAIGGVALNALLVAFMVIYSIDVRVRREGYDLLLAAQDPAH